MMETIYFALGFVMGALFAFLVSRVNGDELDIDGMDEYDE